MKKSRRGAAGSHGDGRRDGVRESRARRLGPSRVLDAPPTAHRTTVVLNLASSSAQPATIATAPTNAALGLGHSQPYQVWGSGFSIKSKSSRTVLPPPRKRDPTDGVRTPSPTLAAESVGKKSSEANSHTFLVCYPVASALSLVFSVCYPGSKNRVSVSAKDQTVFRRAHFRARSQWEARASAPLYADWVVLSRKRA